MSEIDFDALFASHHRRMIGLVSRIVGPNDAEDVAQIAWKNAWKFRASFEGGAAASTWLYRIASNTALSWLRSTKKRKLEEPIDDHALTMHDPRPFPERALLRLERQTLVRAAIATLPSATRAVMFKVYVEGQRVREVGGMPLSTMKSRLHRGRGMLKKKLRAAA